MLGKAGLTAAIHSATDNALTRSWAEATAAAGFHGARYLARHDPAARLTSIATQAESELGLLTVPRRVQKM